MTPEQALDRLREIREKLGEADPEVAHERADTVLCEFLLSLGYVDIVNAWERVPKWYA